MAAAEAIGLNKRFKMETSIALSNMVLFDEHGECTWLYIVTDLIHVTLIHDISVVPLLGFGVL